MWQTFITRPKTQRYFLISFLALSLSLSGFLALFWQWSQTHATPTASVLQIIDESRENVSFSTTNDDQWLVFLPTTNKKTQGIILYPGALVTPYAYANLATTLATAGYPVVIPHMPFNLALTNADVYSEIATQFPTIQSWALGGHSLGGAFASLQVDPTDGTKTPKVNALFYLGAYPTADFSQTAFPMLNIWASEDVLVSESTRLEALPKFSTQTLQIEIIGGNHAQFGSYGEQAGDGIATITNVEQQKIIADAFLEWLPTLP